MSEISINPKSQEKNKFNLAEVAGSLGDLGTLIPFLIAYLYTIKLEPLGLLLCFGLFNIIIGWYYKTPIPVQPMKAVATLAIANAAQITPGVIWGAGLFMGIFWLAASVSGLLEPLGKWIDRTVIKGLVLGLGFVFFLESLKMLRSEMLLSIVAVILALLLSKYQKIPLIFIILVFGLGTESYFHTDKLQVFSTISPHFSLPRFNFYPFTLDEFIKGVLILAIPQIPLTLGNGIFAVASENNELFPYKQTSAKRVAITTGLMNLVSPFLGGIPMCHGAGGMVGHVKFGARTGGATIFLGIILVILALFFRDSIPVIIELIPQYILGVMIFLVSMELMKTAVKGEKELVSISVLLVTALIAIWNSGFALVLGICLSKVVPLIFKKEDKVLGS